MTQEEKQLLLQDLCARLPYDVCVHIRYKTGEPCYGKLTSRDIQWFIDSKIENIKPYLRPLSSMTDEEKKIMRSCGFELILYDTGYTGFANIENYIDEVSFRFMEDFLNSHHFDYRGLIEKELALKAPEGMYK